MESNGNEIAKGFHDALDVGPQVEQRYLDLLPSKGGAFAKRYCEVVLFLHVHYRLKGAGGREVYFNDWCAACTYAGRTDPVGVEERADFTGLGVMAWMDLSTGMRYMVEVMVMYTFIVVGIILLALLFSIINTMVMAVLDRVKELGMLMAVGMTKTRIFFMDSVLLVQKIRQLIYKFIILMTLTPV